MVFDKLVGCLADNYNENEINVRRLCMWMIKLPFKLIALPLIFLLAVVGVAGKIVTHLSAYVVGLAMLLLFLLGLFCAFQRQWGNVIFLLVCEVILFLAQFMAMFFADIAGEWRDSLVRFVRS